MPASSSTAGRTTLRTRGEAISDRKTAVPTASGVPIASAPSVTTNEPCDERQDAELAVGRSPLSPGQERVEPHLGQDRPRLPADEREDERNREDRDERAQEEQGREQPLSDLGLARDERELSDRVPLCRLGVSLTAPSLPRARIPRRPRRRSGPRRTARSRCTPWQARSAHPSVKKCRVRAIGYS